MWRINGSKQIVKVILCCGRYCDGNRPGRHGNAAGSFGVSNSQTYGRVRTKAPHLRYSVEQRVNPRRFRLVAEGGRRVRGGETQRKKGRSRSGGEREGEREGERGSGKSERYVGGKGRVGGPLVVERVAKVRGGGKKRRASCYTPRVFLHKSPWRPFGVRYSNGLGETAAGRRSSLPRLSGTPALTIILLKEGKTSLSGEILPIPIVTGYR